MVEKEVDSLNDLLMKEKHRVNDLQSKLQVQKALAWAIEGKARKLESKVIEPMAKGRQAAFYADFDMYKLAVQVYLLGNDVHSL